MKTFGQGMFGLQQRKGVTTASKKRPAIAAFHESEDPNIDLEATDKRINKPNKALANRTIQAQSSFSQREAKILQNAAMEEDPNIFDYDGVYDDIKATTASHPLNRSASDDAPKPKYIQSLMAVAKVREKEQDRRFEKKLLKEREVEDNLFPDQEKFITTAYKEKLMESKKWEYEDRLTEEIEKKNDAKKIGMQSFYSNLLTKNVSTGSKVDAASLSAYTAGSQRQANLIDVTNKTSHEEDGKIDASAISSAGNKRGVYNEAVQNITSNSNLIGEETENSIAASSASNFPSSNGDNDVVQSNESNTSLLTFPASSITEQPKIEEPEPKNIAATISSAKDRYLARKMQKI